MKELPLPRSSEAELHVQRRIIQARIEDERGGTKRASKSTFASRAESPMRHLPLILIRRTVHALCKLR